MIRKLKTMKKSRRKTAFFRLNSFSHGIANGSYLLNPLGSNMIVQSFSFYYFIFRLKCHKCSLFSSLNIREASIAQAESRRSFLVLRSFSEVGSEDGWLGSNAGGFKQRI